MALTKRIVFSFDARAVDDLNQFVAGGQFTSIQQAIRDALYVARAIQIQASEGYTELRVRNPETKKDRVLVIPALYLPSTKG